MKIISVFITLILSLFTVSDSSASVIQNSRSKEIQRSKVIRLRYNKIPSGEAGSFKKAIIEQAARDWSKYANVDFVFTEGKSDFDIDVYYSTNHAVVSLGTHGSADFGKKVVSLNMPEYASVSDQYRVALHELGHVLGLQHEHQHPDRNFTFNVEYLLSKCSFSSGKCQSIIAYNNSKVFDGKNYSHSAYDSESIMHYQLSKPVINESLEIEERSIISLSDKLMMIEKFPGRATVEDTTKEHAELLRKLEMNQIGNCRIEPLHGNPFYLYFYPDGKASKVADRTLHKASVSAFLDPGCN